MENAGILELFENIAHLEAELNDFVLGKAFFFHHGGKGLAVVRDNEQLSSFFLGVIFNHNVDVVADVSQTFDSADKIYLVLDVVDVFAVIETSRKFVIGETRFLLVVVLADEPVDFAFISV